MDQSETRNHWLSAWMQPRTSISGAPGIAGDASLWTLVVTNLIALVLAHVFAWRLHDLMAIYWAQSIVIGASYVARMLDLQSFSTDGLRINNRRVSPTAAVKRQTARFFALHFGFFHFVYLMFILEHTAAGMFLELGFIVCVVAFAANHFYSYRYHRELDRRGKPNLGRLMVTPYARIVPMHLAILFGTTAEAHVGLLLFGVLKTAADVIMHVVEHRTLAGGSAAA